MEIRDMYAIYQTGASLREVAKQAGITHVTVMKRFREEGFALRERSPIKHAVQEFNGKTYTRSGGERYYRSTSSKNRTTMHIDVWEYHNGPVPEGYHVHHIDEDRENNDITNLQLIAGPEHTSMHKRRHFVETKTCAQCGQEFGRGRQSHYYIAHRTYCSRKCYHDARWGR